MAGSVRSLFRRKWVEKKALKHVSLRVGEGEIVGLIGANGAGKTTLTKMCAGIIHPTSGTATVLGHVPWQRADAFRRQISLIMGQKQQLWWDLPAADGFLLLREIYQVAWKDYHERVDFLANALSVKDLLTTQVRRLSLGERMKMELMAALIHQPRVVFLDEPTIGLDLTAQRAIRQFLLDYRRVQRPAMLLTSHYMEDIERLCERIVILRQGEVLFDGPLQTVLTRYSTHKTLTLRLAHPLPVHLPPGHDVAELLAGFEPGHGNVQELTAETLRVRVRQGLVTDVAAALLKELPVVDLTIENDDIGNIIEGVMREGLAT